MGWFDTALSVATTVGKIAGALSGAGDEVVDFGPTGSGAYPNLGDVMFLQQQGKTVAYNQSTRTGYELFLPGNFTLATGPLHVELAAAPVSGDVFDISPAFSDYSNAGVDAVMLTPGLGTPSANGDAPNPGDVNIQAEATQPIPAGVEVQLSSYITLKLNASDRTVLVGVLGGLTLTGIVLLNIRGAGTTVVRIINAIRKPSANDDPAHITVDVPQGIDVSNGLTAVDICVAVGNSSALYDNFKREHAHLFTPLSEESDAMLRRIDAARANGA